MPDAFDIVRSARDVMSIARCRELLGPDATGLSDEEVEALRRHAETMAHILIEIYLSRRTPQP